MKIILLIILSLFFTTAVFAQALSKKKAAKYNTSTLKESIDLKHGGHVYLYQENSNEIKFTGHLDLLNASMSQGDLATMGTGIGADFFLPKTLGFHFDYTKALLLDVNRLESRDTNNFTNHNLNGVSGSSSLEAGVYVYLKDGPTRARTKIILESKRISSRFTVNFFIDPKLPCRRVLALRAGYLQNNTVVTTDMAGGTAVRANDGTMLGKGYYLNAYTGGAYIGLGQITFISSLTKNSFKKGSLYLSREVNEMYFDILFAGTTFSSVQDTSGTHSITANAPGSFKTLPIGARIGFKSTQQHRWSSCSKFEVGYRPGLQGYGLYLAFGMAIALIK